MACPVLASHPLRLPATASRNGLYAILISDSLGHHQVGYQTDVGAIFSHELVLEKIRQEGIVASKFFS